MHFFLAPKLLGHCAMNALRATTFLTSLISLLGILRGFAGKSFCRGKTAKSLMHFAMASALV